MKMYKLLLFMSLFISACGSSKSGPQGVSGQPGVAGVQGVQGERGIAGESVMAQAFCPTLHGGIGFQESYVLISGWPYAVYYDGVHTFLTKLIQGEYSTTDGRNCQFKIKDDGSIVFDN